MPFHGMHASYLAGVLAVVACSSNPATPGSSAGISAGGDSSTGGSASTAGSSGNASAGSDMAGAGGAATTGGGSGTPVVVDGSAPTPDGPTGCGAIIEEHPSEGNLHENLCTPLVYQTNPPSSGNHYPVWAAYQTYTKTFLPGFWVHNLEHGAVVITYNCQDGCAADVAAAQAFIDSLPADCPFEHKRRLLMLPDPDLDVRFAASAWGYTLRASCFDRSAFAKFVADHYAHGLEPVCDDGYDPLTAATGGKPICP